MKGMIKKKEKLPIQPLRLQKRKLGQTPSYKPPFCYRQCLSDVYSTLIRSRSCMFAYTVQWEIFYNPQFTLERYVSNNIVVAHYTLWLIGPVQDWSFIQGIQFRTNLLHQNNLHLGPEYGQSTCFEIARALVNLIYQVVG